MTDGAVFLLSLAGFALLLLAVPKHQQDWLRRKPGPRTRRGARAAGLLLLVLAYVVAGLGLGWGYGAVAWLGWLTIAAALVVAAHTNRDRILKQARR